MLNVIFNTLTKRRTLHPEIINSSEFKLLWNSFGGYFHSKIFVWRSYKTTTPIMETNEAQTECTFVGKRDRYNGIIVNCENNQCLDSDKFTAKLEKSIERWKKDGIRGLWFNLSLEYAFWVPILAKNGFTFHRAEGNNVTMIRWLPEEEENGIPAYAHTMVGAGAVVVNSRGELLVVSEKYKLLNVSHWKLPGGYVERGERIADAAIREVFEETGVKTKFVSLVAFRHSQGAAFDCCDLYFVVELTPLSDDEQINKDDREIEACKWMKIEEYIEHPQVLDNNKNIAKHYLTCKNEGISIKGETTFHQLLSRQQTLFMIDFGKNK